MSKDPITREIAEIVRHNKLAMSNAEAETIAKQIVEMLRSRGFQFKDLTHDRSVPNHPSKSPTALEEREEH